MKRQVFSLTLLAIIQLQAAEPVAPAGAKPVSSVKSAAVAELRGNDHAFALMIESYRQIQELMIEGDYNKRVELANAIANPKERDRISKMALDERNMRLTKLEQTLQGFHTAYSSSRKDDERKTGEKIAVTASSESAASQLKTFVPFQPKGFRVEIGPSDLVPAGAQMLYGDAGR
jgi:hypothetical protein